MIRGSDLIGCGQLLKTWGAYKDTKAFFLMNWIVHINLFPTL